MMSRWGTAIISKLLFKWRHSLLLLCAAAGLSSCSGYLFYPAKQIYATPDLFNFSYRDVFIDISDGPTLHGWWVESEHDAQGVVYYLHGNGGNISTNLKEIAWLSKRGYHVFMLDYRGYGLSSGAPSVAGLIEDVQVGWHWILTQPASQGKPLYVFGQSLGATIGGYAMASIRAGKSPSAIVLDSGFANYSTIAREAAASSFISWPFQLPVGWSMPDGYDLDSVMVKLSETPLFIMHSRDDKVVPFEHAEKLLEAAQGRATFYPYGGYHIGALRLIKHREAVVEFFDSHRQLR
jgi:hypothetical protein